MKLSGEVYNDVHKEQRNQSKKYNEKGKFGYKHDGIMFFKIHGRKIQVGFLEVVGNACINNDSFKNDDTEKILKGTYFLKYQIHLSDLTNCISIIITMILAIWYQNVNFVPILYSSLLE